MTLSKSFLFPILCFAAAGGVVVFAFTSSSLRSQAAPSSTVPAPSLGTLVDVEAAPSTQRLLDVAFAAASKLPTDPHIKNKARNQELVVDASLALELPVRALDCAEDMDTWRKGHAFAALAVYAARRGATAEADRMIDRANKCAVEVQRKSEAEENTQGWQRDRIVARVAEASELLKRSSDAAAYASNLGENEASKLAAVRAESVDEAGFEAELAAIDGVLATASFETAQGTLGACARLFRKFYADVVKREALEARFASAWSKMPLPIRIDLTLTLSDIAADAGDLANAKRLVDEARTVFESVAWQPEDGVTASSRIAAARFRAGDVAVARTELASARDSFDAHRSRIVDVFRAAPLRALAEAYGVVGDAVEQRASYAQAVEEGLSNPNGRPRVDDLVATCCSMARNGFEPNAELWKRLDHVQASLVAPW